MGVKTAVLAYSDAAVADVLRDAPPGEIDRAAALAGRVRPGHDVERDAEAPWMLAEALCPPEGTVCALSVPGLDLVCDQEVMLDRPSRLPGHLVGAGRGRRLYLHAMHSAVDWLAFAVWEDGRLVRSLSLSPDGGVIEDIGEPLPFESPYWDGRHAVELLADEQPYPLPFHPLELGERAMLEFFGFFLEGCAGDFDGAEPVVDVWGVELPGFRATPRPQG
ncbi:hypothetical protein FNH05_14810 [Amycolatopsis rhizosphaerae]|uniref:Uncharacterized protein n=1 Tax=Amycolatopsis rhizosphaerae TaxID=2053003 RepID=A0A558CRR7_9PSEU|nr:hypothetical protein [Amycolatopsis rhizosphaerae]TVT51465.1 hypothetical protein FNH05_14810 [Amycolatopsis rhizosphaerae]